jgi:pyrroline-5-carboxylate reductase
MYDRHFEKAEFLAQQGYGKACKTIQEACLHSEIIILAVKPQNIEKLAESMRKELTNDQLLISLLAGTTLETLSHYFPSSKIIRMMPNLPLIYGEGVIGLSSAETIKEEEKKQISKIFELLGVIYWLPEEKINALSSLTGSGPAFFYLMMEAMIESGIAMGFTAVDAQKLVAQMVRGSLTLLEKSCKHPGALKWQITSPQGTTIAGLKKMEEAAVRSGIINTFLATYERANALSILK